MRKKLFIAIVVLMSINCYSQQTIYLSRYLRLYGKKIQYDSTRTGSWKDLATEGFATAISGQINNLTDIPNRQFSALQGIPTTITGYGISDAVNSSRLINTGFGLLGGGDLTADRTFKADTNSTGLTTWLRTKKVADSLAGLISAAGGGTVLSVARTNGYAISASVSDPTINPNITIGLDSATLFGAALRRKDSVANGYYPYSSNPKGYLVSSDLSGYVQSTRTINGKLLSSDITLILASSDFANQGTATTVLHGNASGSPSFSQIVNADVSNTAAIGYSKLSLLNSIVNADISSSAAIAYSKLNLTGQILNGDIVNNTIDLSTKVTGNLAVSHFNSGTGASSSTAWFGDGTWKSIPSATNFYYQNMVSPDSSFVLRNDSTLLGKAYIVTANSNRIRQVAHAYVGDSIVNEPIDVNVANLGTGISANEFLKSDSTWSPINLASDVTGTLADGSLSANVVLKTSTQTLTNKRWTARVGSTTSSATPTINTDNYDIYKLTAQAVDITSFTTNLTGTPVDGDVLEIQITGTASRAITWGTSFVSSTVTLPTTTSSTATLTVIFQYYTTSSYGNNKWVCVNYY